MPGIDAGNTAWLLTSAALVMFMTPGLALFYGGLVRSKNVLGTIMQSFFALALVSVLWVLLGYTLAFGPDGASLIGGLDLWGFRGVGQAPSDVYATTAPHVGFALYQMMFAVITPALIAGAFAERMRFAGYLLFIGLWVSLWRSTRPPRDPPSESPELEEIQRFLRYGRWAVVVVLVNATTDVLDLDATTFAFMWVAFASLIAARRLYDERTAVAPA
jgi:hypothetical protein